MTKHKGIIAKTILNWHYQGGFEAVKIALQEVKVKITESIYKKRVKFLISDNAEFQKRN